MEKKELKIHGFYIISILIAIIICLAAFQMGDNEKMIEYISFAATISSILLAVIAIIYSFYSNSAMSQSLGSLDSISREVIKNTLQMTEATENLKSKIEEIPTFLKPIEDKADLTNSRLEQLSKNTSVSTPINIDKQVKMNYLSNSSFLGLKALYTAVLSYQKSKPFKFSDISNLSINNTEMYLYAYYISTAAFGLIRHTVNDNEFTITNIDQIIIENIKDTIYKRADSNDVSNTNLDLRTWKSEVVGIENYFSN